MSLRCSAGSEIQTTRSSVRPAEEEASRGFYHFSVLQVVEPSNHPAVPAPLPDRKEGGRRFAAQIDPEIERLGAPGLRIYLTSLTPSPFLHARFFWANPDRTYDPGFNSSTEPPFNREAFWGFSGEIIS